MSAVETEAMAADLLARRQPVQAALAAVIAELPNIGKGDRSPEGYTYRGIEAVTKHVQPLFAKHGVVIAPSATITDVRPSPAMKDGWQDIYMQAAWTITGPDGSTIEAQTTGIGRDRADKGANKAQTQAYKYLLLHLLCIADGKDDTDSVSYEHDRQEVDLTGWVSIELKTETWDELKDATKDEGVIGWVKAQRINFGSFTPEVADEWAARLAEVEPPSSDGAVEPEAPAASVPAPSLPLEEPAGV